MFQVVNHSPRIGWTLSDSINSGELLNFPYIDLRTIDRLWVTYSNGRYGFSVQKKIWFDVGKNFDDFCTRVRWDKPSWIWESVKTESINYDGTAPLGHLPFKFHCKYNNMTGPLLNYALFVSPLGGYGRDILYFLERPDL